MSHDCITGSSLQLIEVKCFLKLSADQLLILIDHRLRSIMKRPYNKKLINLVCRLQALSYFPFESQ